VGEWMNLTVCQSIEVSNYEAAHAIFSALNETF